MFVNLFSVSLNSDIKTAEYINLYLEVTPAQASYHLDNVVFEKQQSNDGAWDDGIEDKIDTLRKKNVTINFFDIVATDLVVDVEQVTHGFPFGHAVVSNTISDCHIAEADDEYCQHVKNNYNWIVDTYRLSIVYLIIMNNELKLFYPSIG